MSGAGEVVAISLFWAVPLLLVVYLFRTLSTIVAGLRAINATTLRIAEGVEAIAAQDRRPNA